MNRVALVDHPPSAMKRILHSARITPAATSKRVAPARPASAILVLALLTLAPSSAFAQLAVLGTLSRDIDATPGSHYSGSIDVYNGGTEVRQAKVYQTDYSFNYRGENNFETPGANPRSNAAWVRFSPAFVTIPPGETAQIQFEVNVPPDAEADALAVSRASADSASADSASNGPAGSVAGVLSGSYWSMLMIEDVPANSPESTIDKADDEFKIGVREVFRYGVQIATHIHRSEDYAVEFLGVGLVDTPDSSRALKVAVANTGNAFMRPAVWIEVFDAAGNKRAKIESTPARMYPDTSVTHVFDMSQFEQGAYEVLVVVDAGEENIYGAQYALAL